MKLAILGTRGIPAQYGGFETFAEEISVRLVEQGIDVTVFCEKKCNEEKIQEYKGVKLKYISTPNFGAITPIIVDLLSIWGARKDYDLVYMLGYGGSPFFFIPRLFGKVVWVNMDGLEWKRSKWSFLARLYIKFTEKIAMYSANKIIADAQAIYDDLYVRYRNNFSSAVIPYGAYTINQAPAQMILDEYNLFVNCYYLVVCRLEPENHILEIIRGYMNSNSNIPLVIVGNHKVNSQYVSTLVSFSSRKVIFLGSIYDQEKLQALRYYCYAYFHGHCVGGTNPSLLEAMGASNIVIAHKNSFNKEVLGCNALYFDNEDKVAKIVMDLEHNYDNYSSFKKNVKLIIENKYTWENITQQYLQEIFNYDKK